MQIDNWGVISWVLIGNLVIDGIAIFVIQRIIENRMNRSLEEFKTELSSRLQKEHIRLSVTIPKLLETLDELNSQLVQVQQSMFELNRAWLLVHSSPPLTDVDVFKRAQIVFTAYKNFTNNKMFRFPAELSGAIVHLQLNLVQQKHGF